jgi:hypothetical protein
VHRYRERQGDTTGLFGIASHNSDPKILDTRAQEAGGLSEDPIEAYLVAKFHIVEAANIVKLRVKCRTPSSLGNEIYTTILAYKAVINHDLLEFRKLFIAFPILCGYRHVQRFYD